MAQPQHKDATLRYQQQVDNARTYVLPFIEQAIPVTEDLHVMEIGCGDGGVLVPFLQKGCRCVGVDVAPEKIALAQGFLNSYIGSGRLHLINKDIHDIDFRGELRNAFDLVILKDAIEHIPDQEKIIGCLKDLLTPRGQVYFGFPPWYMPHGGHQQLCHGKFLSMMPFIHLLPAPLYRCLLKAGGEDDGIIRELMEIKDTGISIERFERIARRQGYTVTHKQHYLINPIYKYKFGLQPLRQWAPVTYIPFFRNFITTCVYYMIKP